MGSIPVWPLGTEYRITLARVPDDKELRDLEIANKMRGWVGIAFQDVEISADDHQRLRSKLQDCHLFVVRDGTMKPLGHIEEESDEPADATERRSRAL